VARNISLTCASGDACDNFNFTFNESNFNISQGSDKNITLTISIPKGYNPVSASSAKLVASGNAGISDYSDIYIYVPTDDSWNLTKSPTNFNKTVGAYNNGTIGVVNINNTGNVNISYDIIESGTGTDYVLESNSSFVVPKQTSKNITIYYNANTSNVTVYYPTLNFSSSGTPSSESFTFYLKILNLSVDLLSPTNDTPITSVTTGQTNLEATATVFKEGQEVNSSDVLNWTVYVNNVEANLTSQSYIPTSNYWKLLFTAPNIADGEWYALKAEAHYTNASEEVFDAVSYDTKTHSIKYKDLTAPTVENLTYVAVGRNQNATITADCSDNIGISNVTIVITHPDGSVTTGIMTNTINNTYSYTFTNTSSLGDYNYTVTAIDIPEPDSNEYLNTSASRWFEVYSNVTLNVTSLTSTSSPSNATYKLLRPSTGEVLQTFTIDPNTGTAGVVNV